MKNKLFIFIFVLVLLSSFSALAAFPKSHIVWTIDSMNEISENDFAGSCKPYLNILLDGNNGADGGVLHYGGSLVTSYIQTHTLGGYNQCIGLAGGEIDIQCHCIGDYTHIIQDSLFHLKEGVVYNCLKKYVGSNYFGHMACERDFENKHLEYLRQSNDYAVSSGKLDYYNSKYMDTLIDSDGKASKYLLVENQVAGIDLTKDIKAIKGNYQGKSFYSATAKDRYSFPIWAIMIPVLIIIFSLGFAFIMIYFGSTNWKWLSGLVWILITIIGIIVLYALLTGNLWNIITFTLDTSGKFGYLTVNEDDIKYYHNKAMTLTTDYLKTGNTPIQDASGLSYCPKEFVMSDGTCTNYNTGALNQAETPFQIAFYFILTPLFVILQIILTYKTFKRKKK